MHNILLLICTLLLSGCLGMPPTVEPVKDFQLNRYLGKWYEIARLDHAFERGLTQVSAEYRLKQDGGVMVINRGFSAENNQWETAEGKAYFVNDPTEGYLKVSFFGPFYGSYVVFGLDHEHYQYAFISGPNTDYLWLLAKTPTVAPEVIAQFVSIAKAKGFDTNSLIYVPQDPL